MNKALTQKQQFWLNHSQAADKSHLSISAYAKQHQLNIQAFYNYRNILREKGLIANQNSKPKTASFIQVLSHTPSTDSKDKSISSVVISLPNNIRIDISRNEYDLTQLVGRLMAI